MATDVHALVVSATPEVASFSRRAFISAFPLALRVWQGVPVETLSSKKHHAAERLWRRHVARVSERGLHFMGSGGPPPENF